MNIYNTNSYEMTYVIAYLLIIALVLIFIYVFAYTMLSIKNNEKDFTPKLIISITGLCMGCFLTSMLFNHGNNIREITDYYKSNSSTIIDKKYSNGMFNDSYSIIAKIDVNGEKFQFKEYITENQYNLVSIGDAWNYNKK